MRLHESTQLGLSDVFNWFREREMMHMKADLKLPADCMLQTDSIAASPALRTFEELI